MNDEAHGVSKDGPDGDRRETDASSWQPDATHDPFRAILDRIRPAGEGERLRVGDIMEKLGQASFGPLLLVPALLIVTPLSGIPGLSSIGGIVIALIAAQMAFGRDHVWLPGWIVRRKIDRRRFVKAVDAMNGAAAVADRLARPRLQFLVRPPFSNALQLVCLACGLAMPFLELVPFSSSLLAAAICFFAIALVARDGLVALLGLVMIGGGATAIALFVTKGLSLF